MLSVLLLLVLPAAAQRVLTWDDAVAQAARLNPDLASARAGAAASRAGYLGSYNGVFPRLTLSNSFSDSQGSTGQTRYSAQAAASVDLFDYGTLATIRGARSAARQAEASVREASSDLRFALRRAFSQVLFSQDNIGVSRRIAEIRERNSRLVGLRYESGRESKGNMMRAAAQRLQAESDLRRAERALDSDRAALDRQLGLDAFEAVLATGTLAGAAPPPKPDFRALVDGRPDVERRREAVTGAQADLGRARAPLFPSLSANYARARTGPSEFPSARSSWSAGATLSYSLLAGGPTAFLYDTRAAVRRHEQAEQTLRLARQKAAADLSSAWAELASAAEQVQVQEALLGAARQRNEEADVRYASGLLSFDNWELIVSDRVSLERQALSARLAHANAEAAWSRELGLGLGEESR